VAEQTLARPRISASISMVLADGKYWEQQILALKEQLAALQEAPLTLL